MRSSRTGLAMAAAAKAATARMENCMLIVGWVWIGSPVEKFESWLKVLIDWKTG